MNNGSYLGIIGISTVGFFSLAGYLFVPSVGAIGGAALGGFTFLLAVPFMPAGAALGAGLAKYTESEKFGRWDLVALSVICAIGGLIAALAASHAICNNISSLQKFSFIHSLETFGHTTWMTMILGLICYGIHKYNNPGTKCYDS